MIKINSTCRLVSDDWHEHINKLQCTNFSKYVKLYSFIVKHFRNYFSWWLKSCPCYIIAEGFFFILSFFVGYILSYGLVRLRTFQLTARVRAHIERRCSRSRGEDVTITDVITKTPDRKCTRVCWVSELRADAGRTVSIIKIVSLSPRVENLKVKNVIKVSYLNQCYILTDAMRKTSLTIFTSRFICKGSKRLCGVLLWEGGGDRT